MSYLNSVSLIGNLGKDPEILKEDDKGKFVRLQLATTKKYRDANDKIAEDTQWHTVYLNNGSAKFAAAYLKKGDKVLIIGELRTNKWVDKEGITQFTTAVYGKECKSLSSKSRPSMEKAEVDAASEEASTAAAAYC